MRDDARATLATRRARASSSRARASPRSQAGPAQGALPEHPARDPQTAVCSSEHAGGRIGAELPRREKSPRLSRTQRAGQTRLSRGPSRGSESGEPPDVKRAHDSRGPISGVRGGRSPPDLTGSACGAACEPIRGALGGTDSLRSQRPRNANIRRSRCLGDANQDALPDSRCPATNEGPRAPALLR